MNISFVDGVEQYTDGSAFMSLWLPTPGLLYSHMDGDFGEAMLAPLLRACERAIRGGNAVFFNDWERLKGYQVSCRIELTRWAMSNRRSIERSHVLLRSKLVAISVDVANVAVGGIYVTHTDRERFELVLVSALRSRGLTPPPRSALFRA